MKAYFILCFVAVVLFACQEEKKKKSDFELGVSYMGKLDYKSAKLFFKDIKSTDLKYDSAQMFLDFIKKSEAENKNKSIYYDVVDACEKLPNLSKDINSNSVDAVLYNYDILDGYVIAAKLALKTKNDSLVKLGNKFKSQYKKLAPKIYTKLRKCYGDAVKNNLWKEDIEVSILGSNNTTLQFVGAYFAANKNKSDMQSAISDIVHKLRFKRVNYKWYKYDDEYTYYDIKSNNDTDF